MSKREWLPVEDFLFGVLIGILFLHITLSWFPELVERLYL